MRREVQGNVLTVVGGAVLAVGVTDAHLRYVRPGMRWLLVASGLLVLLVGLREVLRGATEQVPGSDEHVGHEHSAPRTAWLLLLPVVVMALISPAALGAFSAERAPSRPPPQVDRGLPPLTGERDGAVDLTLSSFSSRVAYAPASFGDTRVRLLGFVSAQGDGWAITRLQLSCCAADGRPIKVRAVGPLADDMPPRDTWVEVVGTAAPLVDGPNGEVTAGLLLERLDLASAPRETYE